MMMRRIAVLLALALSGCGGCGPQIPEEDLCANVAQGIFRQAIARELSCGQELTEADLLRLTGDLAPYAQIQRLLSCELDAGLIERPIRQVRSSIASGKMAYDGRRAHECREKGRASRDAGISLTEEDRELCLGVLTGTVKEGAACAHHDECAPEAYCKPSGIDSCAGTCTARLAAGAACDPDLDVCANEARCRKSPAAPVWICVPLGVTGERCDNNAPCANDFGCVNGRCVARQDAGVTCKDLGTNASDCHSGLSCLLRMSGPGIETAGVCSAPAQLGEACGDPEDDGRPPCASCLRCENDRCVAAGPGALCADDIDCPNRYSCGPSGTCVLQPREGEACAVAPLPEERSSRGNCLFDDTFCHRAGSAMGGVCAQLPKIGEPCGDRHDLSATCATGYCKGTATDGGVCAQLPGADEPCGSAPGLSDDCAAGFSCPITTGGAPRTCAAVAIVGEGQSCSSGQTCDRGLFCQADAGLVCAALRGAGRPCGIGEECATGQCSAATATCVQPCNQYQTAGGCVSCASGTRELALFLFFAAALLPTLGRRRSKR